MEQRKTVTELARKLRSNSTPSEQLLWQHLRKRRLGGYRFVRQKPLVHEQRLNQKYFFIADFYCAEKKTIVELDGKIHDYQKPYDYNRDMVLKGLRLSTLRIKNEELRDIETVEKKILNFIEKA